MPYWCSSWLGPMEALVQNIWEGHYTGKGCPNTDFWVSNVCPPRYNNSLPNICSISMHKIHLLYLIQNWIKIHLARSERHFYSSFSAPVQLPMPHHSLSQQFPWPLGMFFDNAGKWSGQRSQESPLHKSTGVSLSFYFWFQPYEYVIVFKYLQGFISDNSPNTWANKELPPKLLDQDRLAVNQTATESAGFVRGF